MNKLKLVTILLMTFVINSYAQTFEVPENYILESKEDYLKYEKNVIEAANWIIDMPITEDRSKRKEVSAFLMKWLTGNPNVSIYLSYDIAPFIDNPDLRMVFIGGLTKYSLDSIENKNELDKNIAGVNAVIEFYENNKKEIGINESVENYIKLKDSGELESTIKSKLG